MLCVRVWYHTSRKSLSQEIREIVPSKVPYISTTRRQFVRVFDFRDSPFFALERRISIFDCQN